MFDSRKIDDFFSGNKPFENHKVEIKSKKSTWLRIVKLGFPCLAATILGVMVVLPNIRKSTDLIDRATMPTKNELEHLHIEQTVFYATDSKNRVSSLTADSVDEVSAGAKEVKINNPRGDIPSDNGNIKISANTGFFNQEDNILRLEENIQARMADDTVVTTEEATYEFDKEYGHGPKAVKINGSWGDMQAEGFEYFKSENILVLLGHNVTNSKKGVLTAEKETRYFQNENKAVAQQNVVLKQEKNTLRADKVIAWFSDKSHSDLEKVEAFGNIKVITPKGTAKGDSGIYNPQTQKVELTGNVQIEQNGNFIKGDKAETDLKTSLSRIVGNKQKGGRIKGTFYKKGKK